MRLPWGSRSFACVRLNRNHLHRDPIRDSQADSRFLKSFASVEIDAWPMLR
jgi:hypothetical protein